MKSVSSLELTVDARRMATGLETARRSLEATGREAINAQRRLDTMSNAGSAALSRLNRSVQSTSRAMMGMNFRNAASEAMILTGGFNNVGLGAVAAASRLGPLAVALVAVTGALGATAKAGDAYTMSIGKINAGIDDLDQANSIYDALYRNAQKSGTAVKGSVDAFARFRIAAEDIGATNQQVIQVVDTLGKAGVVGGSSVMEIQAATTQLGQALASGRLQGDELRSVLEAMPMLAQQIAKNLGTSIGNLREMGAEGKLTSDKVFKALLASTDAINERFERMPMTMARSFEMVRGAVSRVLADMDQQIGSSQMFAGAMKSSIDALDTFRIGFISLWKSGEMDNLVFDSLHLGFAKAINFISKEFTVTAVTWGFQIENVAKGFTDTIKIIHSEEFWTGMKTVLINIMNDVANIFLEKIYNPLASISKGLIKPITLTPTPPESASETLANSIKGIIPEGYGETELTPAQEAFISGVRGPYSDEDISGLQGKINAGMGGWAFTGLQGEAETAKLLGGSSGTGNIRDISKPEDDETASKKMLDEMKKREDELRAYHSDTMNLLTNENATFFDAFKLGAAHMVEEWGSAMEQMHDLGKNITGLLATEITAGLTAMATGTKTAKEAFADMANSIISKIIEMIIQLTIQLAIQQALGMAFGGGGGSIIGAMQMAFNAVPKGEATGYSGSGQAATMAPQYVSQAEMDIANTPMEAKRARLPDSVASMSERSRASDREDRDREAMRAPVINLESTSATNRLRGREGTATKNSPHGEKPSINVHIVNVSNPNEVPEYIAQNPDAIVNAVSKRSSQVRRVLNQDKSTR